MAGQAEQSTQILHGGPETEEEELTLTYSCWGPSFLYNEFNLIKHRTLRPSKWSSGGTLSSPNCLNTLQEDP